MRLFVALNLSHEEKDGVEGIQNALKAHAAAGNFTRRQNLHMTLAFLGQVPPERIPALRNILKITGDKTIPFVLQYDQMGYFSGKGREKLWYLGCERTPELSDLVSRLHKSLKKQGFLLEDRAFVPHVTLCRRCVSDYVPQKIAPVSVNCRSMELMLSEHIDGVLTYTPISSAPFSVTKQTGSDLL